ncbi:MAG: hypothetical protein JWM20_949 [Patescibacteria group bacterium]|nr:hypothetical protein [Patescibacteria group bacterium]
MRKLLLALLFFGTSNCMHAQDYPKLMDSIRIDDDIMHITAKGRFDSLQVGSFRPLYVIKPIMVGRYRESTKTETMHAFFEISSPDSHLIKAIMEEPLINARYLPSQNEKYQVGYAVMILNGAKCIVRVVRQTTISRSLLDRGDFLFAI